MELFPSEYQQLELDRNEKVFIRHALNCEDKFGMLLLKVNPAMLTGESIHVLIISKGVVLCKFLPLNDPLIFPTFASAYMGSIYANTVNIVRNKLMTNLQLVGADGKLSVLFASICVFPSLKRKDIDTNALLPEVREFFEKKCIFGEEFSGLRKNFIDTFSQILENPENEMPIKPLVIDNNNVNSIMQRITPEYTTVRFTSAPDLKSTPGVEDELLVVTEDDVAVRAFRLEPDQVNIVNKITRGDQLILACAGSGKSVLLIAKCFKAARMNPDKRFLITCFNRNLYSLYTWFIERAGLRERNVDCYTFDFLCINLLERNKRHVPTEYPEIRQAAMDALMSGVIQDRYYGIFIDEVQMFETDWYKMCFNLLENKNSDDHIFVICGDKTQELKQRQRHGRAPWNAGEGYPSYRGGSKSIRIEKNYRNCVEINEYINRFAKNARQLIIDHVPSEEYDPDMFLRGQAFRAGHDVIIKRLQGNAMSEAQEAVRSVKELHDKNGVPYDEIAVEMFNRKYKSAHYFIEWALLKELDEAGIPYSKLYSDDEERADRYGSGGVSLITFASVLGLDFQAVVVCGLYPLGKYDRTKNIKPGQMLDQEAADCLKQNIRFLYVACTRAKDYLHIILTENDTQSIYDKLLGDSL